MLRAEASIERVYLYRHPVDMRKQRNALAALVQEVIREDPFSGAAFVFTGKRRDRIKCLVYDRNGFILWYKVIESKERFAWPRQLTEDVITMSVEQLNWLLEGFDVWKMKPHQTVHFSHAA
ncbi:MAG: IS66 family insertion sequence element accessory protein TnpB [Steroidobacteraceae bacterium]